jgi:protoporphyrinogen/coproporphyrinogen III oxidase
MTVFDMTSAKPFDPSARIAIVGAGVSGLTAADTLKRLGYEHVTVFEKNNRVGGKVYSVPGATGIAELGAVLASTEYTLVLELADRYGIRHEPYPVDRVILDEHGIRHSPESFLASRYAPDAIAQAIASYAAALRMFDCSGTNGLNVHHEDLCLPFDAFAAKYGFTPIAELARSAFVGFGYGYYETTPAAYFMKLIGWLLKPGGSTGLQAGEFHMFPTGFQSLWEAMANELDVRLESDVTSIERRAAGTPMQLTVNGSQRHEADVVIVSAPLHTVERFMRLTDDEAALFGQVKSNRYFVNIFTASGLGTGEFLFFHDHERPAKINHVNAWANRNPSVPAYIGWQLADRALGLDDVASTLVQDVAAQGGTLERIMLRQEWDYFPHVGPEAMRNGFHEQVDALQGRGNVFYAGSTLSFETVEHCARFARELMNARFGNDASRRRPSVIRSVSDSPS